DLVRSETGGEKAAAVAGLLVVERNVAGLVGSERQRNAADVCLHRVLGTRFGLEGKLAGLTRACSPCLQVRQRAKGLVFVAIDRRAARFFGARCCQPLWGAFQARCL